MCSVTKEAKEEKTADISDYKEAYAIVLATDTLTRSKK